MLKNTLNQKPEEKIEKVDLMSQKFSISDNLKSISKKAYTIAGTVPSYVFKTSPKKDFNKYEISPASISNDRMDQDMSFNASQTGQNESVHEKPKEIKLKKAKLIVIR